MRFDWAGIGNKMKGRASKRARKIGASQRAPPPKQILSFENIAHRSIEKNQMASKVKHRPRQKQRPRQPKKLSIDELIEAAERAEATGDLRYAVKLLTTAIQKADASSLCSSQNPSDQQLDQQLDHQQQPDHRDNRDNHVVLLDLLERRAELYVTLQSPDSAVQDYQRSLHLLDDEDNEDDDEDNDVSQRKAALHMYLGQLSTGMEALAAYQKGIDCLLQAKGRTVAGLGRSEATTTAATAAATSPDDDEDEDEDAPPQPQPTLEQQLAAAYTSMAELYLTDLCFEDSAESSCEKHLQLALQCDPTSVDALQTLASLQLSQQKPHEAQITVRKVYDQLQTGCRALASLVGLRDNDEQDDDNDNDHDEPPTTAASAATELRAWSDVQALPPYEFRCQTAKLLLETQQAGAAIDVIGSLLAENDQIIEIWILAGDAFAAYNEEQQQQVVQQQRPLIGPGQDADMAVNDDEEEEEPPAQIHYWERAMEMLHVVRRELEQQLQGNDNGNADEDDDDDEDDDRDEDDLQQQMDQVEAQLEELRTKLEEAVAAADNVSRRK
jgi:hypothetical protein